jgi:hypothetical protein
MTPTRGYIFLATGDRHYYEMAINAALSARWKDPGKKHCLIHGQDELPDYVHEAFDDLVELPRLSNYHGVMNKMRLYDICPYDEAFFIDADCFIVKDDMNRHWDKFSTQDVAMAGDRATSGSWYGFDIAAACVAVDAPYLVRGNSGVFFFRKSEAAEAIFEDARHLVAEGGQTLGVIHQGKDHQLADEPFMAAAMGRAHIEPVSYTPEEGSVMITTLYAKGINADMETGSCTIKKPAPHPLFGSLPTDRFFALNYVQHQPTILHFINLKPKNLFQKLSDQVRAKFAVPAYSFFS